MISFLKITFANKIGKFDLEVTTFQMAVLFAWNERPQEKISFENLRSVLGVTGVVMLLNRNVKQERRSAPSCISFCRLASELPDSELRRTLWVCFNFLIPSGDQFSSHSKRLIKQ